MTDQERAIAVSERPLIDTVAAALVIAVHGIWLGDRLDFWSAVDGDTRQVIFQTGAGVVAIVASLASVGLAAGGAGERAKAARRLYGPELRRNWRALLLVSALAPTAAVAAQIADANGKDWAPYVFEFAVLWTTFRLVRLTWLIDRLMFAEERDMLHPDVRTPELELSDDFQSRMKPAS